MRSTASDGAALRPLPSPGDILEQLSTAVLVTDPDGSVQYANIYAEDLFGFPDHATHMTGRPLLSLEDAPLGYEEFDRADAKKPEAGQGPAIPEEDVQLVAEKAGVSEAEARKALEECGGEPAEAIIRLMSR